MASGCDHIEHVRTQIPDALLVGIVSLFICSIPVAFGIPWWLALLVSIVLLFAFLKLAGKRTARTGK